MPDYFKERITSILGNETSLRFHGTTIYYTREILKSGQISSTSYRYNGYENSLNLKNTFSVTDIKNIGYTLSGYTSLSSYRISLPAGCVFVLRANEKEDQDLIKYNTMKTFQLKECPDQFIGICTTPENIPKVKFWLREYGYSERLVYTFEDFLTFAPSLKSSKKTETIIENKEISENMVRTNLFDNIENPDMIEEKTKVR